MLERVRLPEDHQRLLDWLNENKPSEVSKNRDHSWKEWWTISRLGLTQDPTSPLLRDGSVIEKAESPDFMLSIGDLRRFIEITEATHPRDQQEMAIMRTLGRSACPGEFKGRKIDPNEEGVIDVLEEDIRVAVERKAKKPYATRECMLVVYNNSNAWTMIPEFLESLTLRLKPYGRDYPFSAVPVLMSDHTLIDWRPDDVRLIGCRP